MSAKPRMVLVTDPKQIEALMAAGKYRESLPFWTRQGDALWALIDDAFRAWRADRTGKRL